MNSSEVNKNIKKNVTEGIFISVEREGNWDDLSTGCVSRKSINFRSFLSSFYRAASEGISKKAVRGSVAIT